MTEVKTTRKRISNRQILRKIFVSVMETSNQISATIGSAGAIKYEKCMEGKPKYKNDVSFLRFIDYCADVCKAASDTLNEWQLTIFKTTYYKKHVFPDVVTSADLKMQETLAKAFLERGLYPVKRYFKGATV